MSFSTCVGSHLKSSFSQTIERFVIGATRHDFEFWVSGGETTNLVMQGQCKEDVSSQRPGSVNLVNDN